MHILTKMGRPKLDEPRSYMRSVRFSEAERKKIEKYAAEHNTTVALAIRKAVLKMIDSVQ